MAKKVARKVAVLGAGVIGLSVATHLLERFPNNVQVTLIADRFSPHTISSDKSGGWIFPPDDFNISYPSDPERVGKWVQKTMERLNIIYYSKEGGRAGISLVNGYFAEESSGGWSKYVYDFNDKPTKTFDSNLDEPLTGFTTYIVPCPIYLPWLLEQFTGLGGISQERKVNDIPELSSHYDIIINCTGLGARELVNDQQVYPVTGHIVSVNAPWIKHFYSLTKNSKIYTYIFPRSNEVILGGTFEESTNTDFSPKTAQSIIDRCCQVVPSLKGAQVKESWVGVRPYRKGGVRLEKEEKENYILIHCYGHGGDGVSLSWGCAEHVGELVEREL